MCLLTTRLLNKTRKMSKYSLCVIGKLLNRKCSDLTSKSIILYFYINNIFILQAFSILKSSFNVNTIILYYIM